MNDFEQYQMMMQQQQHPATQQTLGAPITEPGGGFPATQPSMMHTMGSGMGQGGPYQGTGMNWGGMLGGQQDWHAWRRDARDQFRDARQEWRQGGRIGDRPTFRNFLFPDTNPWHSQAQTGGMAAPMPATMPAMPPMQQQQQPLGQMPLAPPVQPQVGTSLNVPGMLPPTSPFGIPGYGG